MSFAESPKLAKAFSERVAQVASQRNVPKPDDVMNASARGYRRNPSIGGASSVVQSRREIGRQKRTVDRYAQHPFHTRTIGIDPIETGEQSRQGPLSAGKVIRHERKRDIGDVPSFSVAIQDEALTLRVKTRDDSLEQRAACDFAQCFVAAAHSP